MTDINHGMKYKPISYEQKNDYKIAKNNNKDYQGVRRNLILTKEVKLLKIYLEIKSIFYFEQVSAFMKEQRT